LFPCAKAAGHIVAASHANHKGNGLDNGHCGENNSHSAGSAGSQLADEKRICGVVNRTDQHTDNGGNRQTGNYLFYRLAGQHLITLFLSNGMVHKKALFCKIVKMEQFFCIA